MGQPGSDGTDAGDVPQQGLACCHQALLGLDILDIALTQLGTTDSWQSRDNRPEGQAGAWPGTCAVLLIFPFILLMEDARLE